MMQLLHAARISDDGSVKVVGSADALFPWWSFSKTVLAVCALRLAEEGAIDLDAPRPGKPYTLRQLLQHRAGVPDYGWLPSYNEAVARHDPPWSREKLLHEARADKLDFKPGEGWGYSNIGYMFIGEAIEHATGMTLSEALRQFVTAPLHLDSVALATQPSDFDRIYWPADGYDPRWVYHGCLIGTPLDAARLLDALFRGQLLNTASLREMLDTYHLCDEIPGRPWTAHGYGLGVMSGTADRVGRMIGHSGAGPFSVNAVYRFPDLAQPATIAVFMQGWDEAPAEFAAVRLAFESC